MVDNKLPVGRRVTVKITDVKNGKITGEIVSREELAVYWGYRVDILSYGLERLLRGGKKCLKILTSRKGDPIQSRLLDLKKAFQVHERSLIVFGGPYRGLFEILNENLIYELSDFILNTIPHQATETVRTEEAIYITLGILNILRAPQIILGI